MKKINYPVDRTTFESSYWKIFKKAGLQTKWTQLRRKLIDWSDSPDKNRIYPIQIKDIICGKYEILVDIYLDYKIIKNKKNGDVEWVTLENELFSLFSYNASKEEHSHAFQPEIAEFFMRHSVELELHVCHYCELAYVNAYGFSGVFKDFGHFLKYATEGDIRHYIRKADGNPYSDKNIEAILELQKKHSEKQITEAFNNMGPWGGKKPKKSETIAAKLRNHFDLDHFLPKSQCPIVGLSLYNLVPSCAVCNEKLKGADEIGGNDRAEWLILSPTSDSYSFDKEVRIAIEPTPTDFKTKEMPEKYRLVFSPKANRYESIIREFLLEERYNYHKYEALRLHDLLVDYPKSRIKMLKDVFEGSKTEKEIENDIFGVDYRDAYHRGFSKLYSDIFQAHYK